MPEQPQMAQGLIPVFLPGNERKFTEIRGAATISSEGKIDVVLQNPAHAKHLVEMVRDGKIVALSFDFYDKEADRRD